MRFSRNKILVVLSALMLIIAMAMPVSIDAKKKAKAQTSQTTKSKSKKNSSKNKKSGQRKNNKGKTEKTSSRKKSRTKANRKNGRKRVRYTKNTYTRPVEEVSNDSLTLVINKAVINWIPGSQNPGGLRVNKVTPNSSTHTTRVNLNENFTYLPITKEYISDLQQVVKNAMPDSLSGYPVQLMVGKHQLAYYINRIEKLPEKYRQNPPFVTAADPWCSYAKGMKNDNIALWHSHGRYFRTGANSWLWQRPNLFQTIEDIYPMTFILQYVVPMLENAGANVFLPRERDVNRFEIIVDNDTNDGGEIFSQPYYKEKTGSKSWTNGEEEGFIYDLADFRDTENPFENGTYRQAETVRKGSNPSVAAWYADIPKEGEYAVYVSYKTLPNSTTDAHYTVNYSGGSKSFLVNQTMGGGTWVYLGTFPFKAGYSDKEAIVTLTNVSEKGGQTLVTADAVKIGGGMGNIARSPRRSDIYYDPSTPENELTAPNAQTAQDEDEDDEADEDISPDSEVDHVQHTDSVAAPKPKGKAPVFRTSGLPRYLEGARYWLQWAGFPEHIYSPNHGRDDYKDDYTSRGLWVNYLAGGSRVLPDCEGLNIPIDLSMALHTDAGKRNDDSFVGTLGIYYTAGGADYKDGTPRITSRALTDMLMRQITGDIRAQYEPRWTRRSMWDKSYAEAHRAEVPTSLIELMSHQNYADMVYGSDPTFRFAVGRAIYKGMARFLAERKGREVVIQPLPVKEFAISRVRRGEYKLTWEPTPDPLEPTALPTGYIILERTQGNMGFRKVGETRNKSFTVKVNDKHIHSFKIVAFNEGGLSFDSEILAMREGADNRKPVLIINGFTRISGPAYFSEGNQAGFKADEDFGVPYIKDISFSGHQKNFSKSSGNSFGVSGSDYIDKVIAGNTFDFVVMHGISIANAGYGFVSASVGAVEAGKVRLHDYKTVDLILGKQKLTTVGNGKIGYRFATFPEALQKELTAYLHHGGHLFVSGQYVASDTYGKNPEFVENILGVKPERAARPYNARITSTPEAATKGFGKRNYNYSNTLNEDIYIVENPDVLHPSGTITTSEILCFEDNDAPAGLLTRPGKGMVFIMSVPFETIRGVQQRDLLMREIIGAFDK